MDNKTGDSKNDKIMLEEKTGRTETNHDGAGRLNVNAKSGQYP